MEWRNIKVRAGLVKRVEDEIRGSEDISSISMYVDLTIREQPARSQGRND